MFILKIYGVIITSVLHYFTFNCAPEFIACFELYFTGENLWTRKNVAVFISCKLLYGKVGVGRFWLNSNQRNVLPLDLCAFTTHKRLLFNNNNKIVIIRGYKIPVECILIIITIIMRSLSPIAVRCWLVRSRA